MLPDLSREMTADTGNVLVVSVPAPLILSSMVKSSLPMIRTTLLETCGGAAIVCGAASFAWKLATITTIKIFYKILISQLSHCLASIL
jgi:hypothetical protein